MVSSKSSSLWFAENRSHSVSRDRKCPFTTEILFSETLIASLTNTSVNVEFSRVYRVWRNNFYKASDTWCFKHHVGRERVLTCQNESCLLIACGLDKASLCRIRSLSTGQQVLWLSAPDLMMTGDMKPDVRGCFRWSLVYVRSCQCKRNLPRSVYCEYRIRIKS